MRTRLNRSKREAALNVEFKEITQKMWNEIRSCYQSHHSPICKNSYNYGSSNDYLHEPGSSADVNTSSSSQRIIHILRNTNVHRTKNNKTTSTSWRTVLLIIIFISFMELGHLLTRSGLTYPEVSSNVYHDSFCQLGSSISLPRVIYFEAFYLHVVSSFSCIPVICQKLVLFLTPLQFVHLFCKLSKCILLFFSCYFISTLVILLASLALIVQVSLAYNKMCFSRS